MKNFCATHPGTVAAIAIALLLAGCAGGTKKESATSGGPLAVVQVTRNMGQAGSDCPVSVKISNRTNTAWDGVSYHVALHNRSGVSIGKVLGSPHKPVKAGGDLLDSGQVLGVKCGDLTGAALVYFGYYPAGKGEVHAHVNTVKVILN